MVPLRDQRKLLGRDSGRPAKSAGRENCTWNSGASALCVPNLGSGFSEDGRGVAIIYAEYGPIRDRAQSTFEPDMLGKEINEGAHTRRQGSATSKKDGVNVFPVSRVEFLEHRYEPARFDVRADVKPR